MPAITDALRRIKIPHVFALLTFVILFCSILTYILPSGSYDREERTAGGLTRVMVVPGTFQKIEKHYSLKGIFLPDEVEGKASPASLLDFLASVPRGMESAADIIFFIFIIGGVFSILQATGTIHALLVAMVNRFSDSGPILTIILMTVMAIGGSSLGMGEELIPLVPVFLLVSKELGYDRIYGLALVLVASEVGFAAATTNPFTVQIAQGIADVPLGSGIAFRLIFLSVILSVTIIYVLRYGAKIKKDPSKSIMPNDTFELDSNEHDDIKLEPKHIYILISVVLVFGGILYAVQKMGWWLAEMGAGFLLIGILAAVFAGMSIDHSVKAFVKGCEEMVVAALVVGFAKGIQVVLDDGLVLDSIIYYAASLLESFPIYVAAEGMLVFQAILNFFIPSGSGQAAVTMPLMAPLADVLGLSRQIAVFAFTCGDGFSNSIIPTSGVLMAMLALAKIPYEKWLKFMLPLFFILIAISALFLVLGVIYGI
jgi:uncharacterized ion transporter superfamily protein YfcC